MQAPASSISHHAGAKWIGLLFLSVGILVSALSGPGLIRAFKHKHPLILSCDLLPRTDVAGRWIELSNCQLDIPSAVGNLSASRPRPTELLIPLHPAGNAAGQVHAILQTRHPILIATFLQLQRFNTPDDASAWISRNREMAFPKRSIIGVAHVSATAKYPELAALRKVMGEQFLLLKDYERPEARLYAWTFCLGIGLLILGTLVALTSRKVAG